MDLYETIPRATVRGSRPKPRHRARHAESVAGPIRGRAQDRGRRQAGAQPAAPTRGRWLSGRWADAEASFGGDRASGSCQRRVSGPQRSQACPRSRWDPFSRRGQACLVGGDDPVEPVPRFVEGHRDAYEVKQLQAVQGGTLVAHAPGGPAHHRPSSAAGPLMRF